MTQLQVAMDTELQPTGGSAMVSKLLHAALAGLLLSGAASAVTLTITPDKSTYLVGEAITLSVLGDSQGASTNEIVGRLLYDAALADYVNASQVPLTYFGVPWTLGGLSGGDGFADAFHQIWGAFLVTPDGLLQATVTLSAAAPGTLGYAWQTGGSLDHRLKFFGLTSAPGGTVMIVPEPTTSALLALGVLCLALRRAKRDASTEDTIGL